MHFKALRDPLFSICPLSYHSGRFLNTRGVNPVEEGVLYTTPKIYEGEHGRPHGVRMPSCDAMGYVDKAGHPRPHFRM